MGSINREIGRGLPVTSPERQIPDGRVWGTSSAPALEPLDRLLSAGGLAVPLPHEDRWIGDDTAFAPAIHFISRRYREHLTNISIAKACGMSVRTLERHFRDMCQCSPRSYIRQLRVRLSCQALVFSNRPLSGVAAAYGFFDQSHFTKEFRRMVGMTPRAYRKRYRR